MILEVSRSDGYISDDYRTYGYTSKADFVEIIHGKVQKMKDKLENGRVSEEPAILTGGQYFSEREWNKLIGGYDRTLDKFIELTRERHESLKANSEKQKA